MNSAFFRVPSFAYLLRQAIRAGLLLAFWVAVVSATIMTLGYLYNIGKALVTPPFGWVGFLDVHRHNSLMSGREPSLLDFVAVPVLLAGFWLLVVLVGICRNAILKRLPATDLTEIHNEKP